MDKLEKIFRVAKLLTNIKDKDYESRKTLIFKALTIIENNREIFNNIVTEKWIEEVKKEYSA